MNRTALTRSLLAASLALNLGVVASLVIRTRVIAQLLAERGVLDEQQRERLMDLLLSRYAQESTEEELLHRD